MQYMLRALPLDPGGCGYTNLDHRNVIEKKLVELCDEPSYDAMYLMLDRFLIKHQNIGYCVTADIPESDAAYHFMQRAVNDGVGGFYHLLRLYRFNAEQWEPVEIFHRRKLITVSIRIAWFNDFPDGITDPYEMEQHLLKKLKFGDTFTTYLIKHADEHGLDLYEGPYTCMHEQMFKADWTSADSFSRALYKQPGSDWSLG